MALFEKCIGIRNPKRNLQNSLSPNLQHLSQPNFQAGRFTLHIVLRVSKTASVLK